MNSNKTEARNQVTELNQVLVSGYVASQVHVYAPNQYVFTLRNQQGRFYVQWQQPAWEPQQGQRILVQGSIYSVLSKTGNTTRIQAEEIILLQAEDHDWPGKQN